MSFWNFLSILTFVLAVFGVITSAWIEVFIVAASYWIGLPICHFLGFID